MQEITLPFRLKRPVLACGADMKGAFCLAAGKTAYAVDGFGDLSDLANFMWYEKAVGAYGRRLGIEPAAVVCDLHPGYYSTAFAGHFPCCGGHTGRTKAASGPFRVQHHEAHVASAIVEHRIAGTVIGVAFDGTGFGSDGLIWGGEFFAGSLAKLRRIGHIAYCPMPGGDKAVQEPWRMAISHLYRAYGPRAFALKLALLKKIDRKHLTAVRQMIDAKIQSPLTSSAGRLFDAVGSLVLNKATIATEAEIPIALERLVAASCDAVYPFDLRKDRGVVIIDPVKTLGGVVVDLTHKTAKPLIAAKFHNTVAAMIAAVVTAAGRAHRTKKALLTGGVFQNAYLTKRATALLARSGLTVYTHKTIEANDHGIPVGQVAIAGARSLCV